MAVLDDIDAWLTAGGISDVFLSYLPDGVDRRALIETPAPAPERMFKRTGNAISYSRLQVLARSEDYSVARARCAEVIDRIVAITDEEIAGSVYLTAATINDPFLMQRDDLGRSMVAGAVEVTYERGDA